MGRDFFFSLLGSNYCKEGKELPKNPHISLESDLNYILPNFLKNQCCHCPFTDQGKRVTQTSSP